MHRLNNNKLPKLVGSKKNCFCDNHGGGGGQPTARGDECTTINTEPRPWRVIFCSCDEHAVGTWRGDEDGVVVVLGVGEEFGQEH